MRFWHDKRKPSVTFFLSSPEFCWWRRQRARVPVPGWDEAIRGVRRHRCPRRVAFTCGGRERCSSRSSRSGKPGHGVDDVGQGVPGLRGRESLQGCQRSVSVAAAEVDGRSHTFASLDRFLQLLENRHMGVGGCFSRAQLSLGAQGFYRLFPR